MREFFYKSILVFYFFLSVCMYGIQIIGFLYIYSAARPEIILERFRILSNLHMYSGVTGVVFTAAFSLLFFSRPVIIKSVSGIDLASLRTQIRWQWFFLFLVLAGYILWMYQMHLNIVYLFIFIVAIYSVFLSASCFYRGEVKSWKHPTSYGNFFISALIQGWAILNIISVPGISSTAWLIFILFLLVFDLLIIYNRFVYLSKFSVQTRVITQQLVGAYLLYFLTRLVLGIFIPLILIGRVLLFEGVFSFIAGLFLITAGVIDKMLFIFLTDKPA